MTTHAYTRSMATEAPTRPATRRGRYRWRTALRGRLPYPLLWLAPKGADCGAHEWYRSDETTDRCYHCEAGVRAHEPIDVPVDHELRADLAAAAAAGSSAARNALEQLAENDRELGRQPVETLPRLR